MKHWIAAIVLMTGCATDDGAPDDDTTDDSSDDVTDDAVTGDAVDLDGRWILDVTPLHGTCDANAARIGFDLTHPAIDEFTLTIINQTAPAFGSVAANHGCEGNGDGCFVAVSLVSVVAPSTQFTSFALDVSPEGSIVGKMYVEIQGGGADCNHLFSVAGDIQ